MVQGPLLVDQTIGVGLLRFVELRLIRLFGVELRFVVGFGLVRLRIVQRFLASRSKQ